MRKSKYDREGHALLWALSIALAVVVVMWLAASCGNSENGPPTVSVFDKPSVKTASVTIFSPGVVDESGKYSSIGYDRSGYPAIAYTRGASLYYAKWDGEDWDDQTLVDYPAYYCVSLAFDSSGAPSIAYYDSSSRALMWAYDEDDDGEWDDNENWPMTLADGEGDYGRYCSHDISGNSFGFAFYEADDANLLYILHYGESAMTTGVDNAGDVGKFCSLKFSGSTPTISYYDDTNNQLKFAKYNGLTFDSEVVDSASGDDVGQYTSLSYKSSGVPTIAYYVEDWDPSDGDPYLAVWNTSTSEWDIEALDTSANDYGKWMSHDWVSGTKAGFSFLEELGAVEPYYRLKFILYDGEDYTLHTPDSGTGGLYTSFVWEDSDTGWISHYCENVWVEPDIKELRYAQVDDL